MLNNAYRSFVRICIWLLGVVISVLPIAFAAHTHLAFDVWNVADAINKAGLFRDFFFLTAVITTTTCANVLDVTFIKAKHVPQYARLLTMLFIFFCIYIIAYSCLHFAELVGRSTPLPPELLDADLKFMTTALGSAIVAEIALGWAD